MTPTTKFSCAPIWPIRVEVLGVLVKELVHTLLPPDAGHGKLFKAAAIKIGLQGPMRQARPGPLLHDRLKVLADTLGPLPHARLDMRSNPWPRA